MAIAEDIFCFSQLGGRGAHVEARHAPEHPKVPRTAPTAKNRPAPNVNSAEVEKP